MRQEEPVIQRSRRRRRNPVQLINTMLFTRMPRAFGARRDEFAFKSLACMTLVMTKGTFKLKLFKCNYFYNFNHLLSHFILRYSCKNILNKVTLRLLFFREFLAVVGKSVIEQY